MIIPHLTFRVTGKLFSTVAEHFTLSPAMYDDSEPLCPYQSMPLSLLLLLLFFALRKFSWDIIELICLNKQHTKQRFAL